MQEVRKRNGFMYVPWAMAAKICRFAMNTHKHRANLLHMFPQVQNLLRASLTEFEEL